MTETAASPSTRSTPAATRIPPELREALARLPFAAELSFVPLIRQLEARIADASNACRREIRPVLESVKAVPELLQPIRDPETLERHRDRIRLLLGFVFPDLEEDEVCARAYAPFAPTDFFTTRKYREVFGPQDTVLSMSNGYGERDYYPENMLFAYGMLYHLHYGVEHPGTVFVKGLRNTTTGLERFFQVDCQFRFVEASHPDLDILPEREFARLLGMEDLAALVERMPLDRVVFAGFVTIRYIDITELHNLSLLKSELVEAGVFQAPDRFDRIVQRLRSVLQVPDLEAGITLRYRSMQEHRHCTERSLLQSYEGCLSGLESTIYGEAIRSREPLLVPDLEECACDSDVVAFLRSRGVRSAALVPLLADGEVIGVLELTSRTPDEIHAAAVRKIADLLSPLTIAARRQMDDVRAQIERTLKVHCTAIHPSVEWRFEDAAYQYNQDLARRGVARFPDIVFEDVHPLYGSMDIRGSSDSRNEAIRGDLADHLDLARLTLGRIFERHGLPVADYYDSVLGRFRAGLAEGLSSGDEIAVIDFLHQRVEPFLDYVRANAPTSASPDVVAAIDAYRAEMDPEMRIVYRRRKDYEQSVALINDDLGAHLDAEEAKAQAIFPHYFEKYKTDGVEFNIYVGQSMAADRTFDEVQLKNLRLWQLQLMCGLARHAESLTPRMKVPLRTTPLVLAHASPLTIQFRSEAKQFQVEGSYNIRYAIIKKRIDKSTIRGTGERLTQPGRLSVIYTQDKEGDEYRRYFEYLRDRGQLCGDVEQVELDDLQGVHGLRALRAAIALS